MDANQLEAPSVNEVRKASLGESLIAARERRGLSRETVVEQTHIPAHYVQMLEDDDYRRISDQLYLLPFLRKYAIFLDIDEDESAMRLLREVQRVDSNSSPVRLDEPLDDRRYRRRNWSKPIMFGGLVAVIIGAYIAQSRHNDTDTILAPKLQSRNATLGAPSPFASKATMNSLPVAPSTSAASASRSVWSAPQPTTLGTKILVERSAQPITQAMVAPAARPHQALNLPQRKTPGAGQVPNH